MILSLDSFEEARKKLQQIIKERVLVKDYSSDPLVSMGKGWIFDFRSVLLDPECLTLVTSLLWEKIQNYDEFQIGGLETASIPLITSLVLKAQQEGRRVNGFYIRKSRKKTGLYRNIEGTLNSDPIILVDDLLNTGASILKQLEVLGGLDSKKVVAILTIVRFRDLDSYTAINSKQSGIKIESIFTLKDFDVVLNEKKDIKMNPYIKKVIYKPRTAAYGYVLPKSTPVVSEEALYYGTDEGIFIAIDKVTGNKIWEYKVGYSVDGKHIFSSPIIYEDLVIFGAYDGKVHALDRFYGGVRWIFSEADAVGSSPEIAPDLELLFIGLEFGLPGHRGATVALDLHTGKKVWQYTSSAYTHASPLYIQKYKMLCNGGNEGVMRAFDAKNGEILWQFESEGGSFYDGGSGFSKGDIKSAPVYDEETDRIAFSSMDGFVYVIERASGTLKFRFHSDYHDTRYRSGVYGSPIFTGNFILFASLDKNIYCYNKMDGKLVWKYMTGGRIFSTPVEVNGSIFVGSNDGCLYELSLEEGKVISRNLFSERITNRILNDNDTLYVTTQTNELYAFKK